MGRKTIVTVVAATMMFGLVITFGAGTAVAKGGSPGTFSGSTKCSVTGKLTFDPPLTGLNNGTSEAKVSATLSGCTHATHGKITLTGGHLKGLVGFVSPDNCTDVAINHVLPSLNGGSVAWTPTSEVTASSGISYPSGVAGVVTVNGVTFLQVSYFGGSVSQGSFATSVGSEITVTTSQNDAQLEGKCTSQKGLASVDFTGSAII
jgi:hypothetical protein